MRLSKASRLLSRRQFLAVQDRGRRLTNGEYAVLALPGEGSFPRLGIAVSSKVANAVRRNRVKRWVREAFREIAPDLPPLDLVVVARRGAPAGGLEAARRALTLAREVLSRETGP